MTDQIPTHEGRCRGGFIVSWSLGTGEVGKSVESSIAANISVQVDGEFRTATLAIEGSNNKQQWHVLSDPIGVTAEVSSKKIMEIAEHVAFIRPRVCGGQAGAKINVCLFMRMQR